MKRVDFLKSFFSQVCNGHHFIRQLRQYQAKSQTTKTILTKLSSPKSMERHFFCSVFHGQNRDLSKLSDLK